MAAPTYWETAPTMKTIGIVHPGSSDREAMGRKTTSVLTRDQAAAHHAVSA